MGRKGQSTSRITAEINVQNGGRMHVANFGA